MPRIARGGVVGFRAQVRALIEAALDQPQPTPELRAALAPLLTNVYHADRERARDPVPVRIVAPLGHPVRSPRGA